MERRTRGRDYRRAVQMVFQDPFASLNPAHDVAHHLRRPLLATGRARRGDDAEQKIAALLRAVNLTPEADMAERDLAVLYATHGLATARHFADEVMVMYQGEIVERGDSDDVILRPQHPYTRKLAAAAPASGRFAA